MSYKICPFPKYWKPNAQTNVLRQKIIIYYRFCMSILNIDIAIVIIRFSSVFARFDIRTFLFTFHIIVNHRYNRSIYNASIRQFSSFIRLIFESTRKNHTTDGRAARNTVVSRVSKIGLLISECVLCLLFFPWWRFYRLTPNTAQSVLRELFICQNNKEHR